jgi:hypothetical protein
MQLEVLYCKIDDFRKQYQNNILLSSPTKINSRKRKFKMSDSEVMTILIMFHIEGYRNLKSYYLNYISRFHKNDFPDLVSYNRFVELQKMVTEPLMMFLISLMGLCTGISFIDSTKISVCNNKRISRNKVFKNNAKIGKSTMGWFFGFKLHIIINEHGELLAVKITKANCDDRKPVLDLSKKLYGKLIGDKGYISEKLRSQLFQKGISLVTSIKKTMKNKLMLIEDKILLRKRSVIETVNDQLKNISQVEHTRHRSINNFITNMISGLVAYSLQPKKPSISIDNRDNLVIA